MNGSDFIEAYNKIVAWNFDNINYKCYTPAPIEILKPVVDCILKNSISYSNRKLIKKFVDFCPKCGYISEPSMGNRIMIDYYYHYDKQICSSCNFPVALIEDCKDGDIEYWWSSTKLAEWRELEEVLN